MGEPAEIADSKGQRYYSRNVSSNDLGAPMGDLPDAVFLERACAALTSLVREEYPEKYSLAEIAYIWGVGISPEQIEALRWLENGGTESPIESASAPNPKAEGASR